MAALESKADGALPRRGAGPARMCPSAPWWLLAGAASSTCTSREGDVFDFTAWATLHPGGPEAIRKWTAELRYPLDHGMERFEMQVSDRRLQYAAR